MRPKTEELLNLLLWTAECLSRPTYRNLTESYESWAYRHGLYRQVDRLESRRLVERDPKGVDPRVVRLTESGRVHALGGRDPVQRWARPWDGQWRMVLFDIPRSEDARRQRMRRVLRDRHYGCLQNSVWITPDPLSHERELLEGAAVQADSLLLLEARPASGETDAEIVGGAWDFARIDRLYARHGEVLDRLPRDPVRSPATAQALRRWGREEREMWMTVMREDPLLPEVLLPPDYTGQAAWRRRVELLGRAGHLMRDFVRFAT